MSYYDDIGFNSDEEVNKKQHARLLDEVLQLDKRQQVKKPTRTEPTTHVSEFNLIKTNLGKKNKLSLNELTKSLNNEEKHSGITKKVKSTFKETTLTKPLEKPQAERLRRSVGFTKTKTELNKWNSIVEKNRVASQLTFPLSQDEIIFETERKPKKNTARYKSELDKELEKLEPVIETIEVEEERFPLNMEELIEQRKEMAKLRARQSYQELKARKQNKIKSKTYHRIQRKDRLKQQIKEFEELQKTNPQEALRKLEQLEKTRVLERMSLRHRSTGQWAKNKQIRAKYDKESRQSLSQQLSLSRELTQKVKNNDSSDSEIENEVPAKSTDNSNPWTSQQNDFTDFVSGYRKYWNEQNNLTTEKLSEEDQKCSFLPLVEKKDVFGTSKANDKEMKNNISSKNTEKEKVVTEKRKNSEKPKVSKKLEVIKHCSNTWTVTSLSDDNENENVEDMFENLQYYIQTKSKEKLTKLQELSKQTLGKRKLQQIEEESEDQLKSNLEFKREKLRPEVDVELKMYSEESEDEIISIKKTLNSMETETINENKQDIDPNKYISAKPIELNTKLPNIAFDEEDSENDDQRAYISEAFADDDVVEEFNKEKKNIIDADTPKDVNLILPGWGSWGGKNIKISSRKKRRFIFKTPKKVSRRDDNKGNLIINEHKDTKIKKHQVSDVPFPFTKVKDFEASIRAPIGDTFVPQTAFRRLIKPAVKTQKGAIIEPMSDSILLKQKFTKQGRTVNN